MPASPAGDQQLTVGFRYNDLASVERLFSSTAQDRGADPGSGEHGRADQGLFPAQVRELCHEQRRALHPRRDDHRLPLAQRRRAEVYDIEPDLSTFGKALANGFSVSALAGKREFMRLGGLDHSDRPRVFLLSTTHGAETHALAAAIATMQTYQREPVIEHMYRQGARLKAQAEEVISAHGLADHVKIFGRPCCLLHGTRDRDGKPSQAFRTLFLQETIRRGVLMPSLTISYSHSEEDVERTVEAIDGALGVYRRALDDGVDKYLVGRPSQTAYRRFNLPGGSKSSQAAPART